MGGVTVAKIALSAATYAIDRLNYNLPVLTVKLLNLLLFIIWQVHYNCTRQYRFIHPVENFVCFVQPFAQLQ